MYGTASGSGSNGFRRVGGVWIPSGTIRTNTFRRPSGGGDDSGSIPRSTPQYFNASMSDSRSPPWRAVAPVPSEGGGGGSRPTPRHNASPMPGGWDSEQDEYDIQEEYGEDVYMDDFDAEPPYSPLGAGMARYARYNAPRNQAYTRMPYQEYERTYGPGGPRTLFSNFGGTSQTNAMPGGPGNAGGSHPGMRRAGDSAGTFPSPSRTGYVPSIFRRPDRRFEISPRGGSVNSFDQAFGFRRAPRAGPARFNDQERSVQLDGSFDVELEPAPLPVNHGVSEDNAAVFAEFMREHTLPVVEPNANGAPNTECPICLEPPSGSHLCVQIKNVPGCIHMIGRACLMELFEHNSDEKKECPLCRTEFLPSNFVVQGSEAWNQLAQGRGGPARAPRRAYVAPRDTPGGVSSDSSMHHGGIDGGPSGFGDWAQITRSHLENYQRLESQWEQVRRRHTPRRGGYLGYRAPRRT
ncbi:zinc ion binding [Pyrenophora seminiperda CCB06]|uniref:Zinc ion binding n=1 Tax=Pyrenophora seminiperda CCB06 TaxID=1302712 RepID=A0A3M7M146_9PLEO|nr:zinc ion binding [Pyrenophora seminiperda CCB06]